MFFINTILTPHWFQPLESYGLF